MDRRGFFGWLFGIVAASRVPRVTPAWESTTAVLTGVDYERQADRRARFKEFEAQIKAQSEVIDAQMRPLDLFSPLALRWRELLQGSQAPDKKPLVGLCTLALEFLDSLAHLAPKE